MIEMRILYLHGFASGPSSQKARFFHDRFAEQGVELEIPELDGGDFEHLTISGQLRIVEKLAGGEPVSLIGSSMGGYLAALYASRHPETRKLVLMAPAFCFLSRWPETFGAERLAEWKRTRSIEVFHYGEKRPRPLAYDLMEDGAQYPDFPSFPQPALIFHGSQDTVVSPELSRQFAARHPNATLEILDSGHELLNVLDQMWLRTTPFL